MGKKVHGRKDFLWCSVLHFGGRGHGWEDPGCCVTSSILLSVTVSEESNFTDQSIGIGPPQSATPAHRSKQNVTRNHSLAEHPQHRPAHVKRPEPLQKIEVTLSLLLVIIS